MRGLTPRQYQVLEYIRKSIKDRGYPPTLREIGSHMGIRSTNGVNDHLRALENKGYLTREDMKSRSLRPTGLAPFDDDKDGEVDTTNVVELKILGRVAAGLPIQADENVVDTLKIDRSMLPGSGETFGLRISGDSMIEAGILHGDYVFVRRQATADRGDIVIALIGDDATCKYYYPEKDHVRFQPANAQMAPILVRAVDFRNTMILGVVSGVFRRV